MKNIDKLLEIMKSLRDPDNGCPWDIRQTSASIAQYTLEETNETLDAIERNDMKNLKEELGDLLFHIVFHSRIAEENGDFSFEDVAAGIVDKMTRRHPHVFGEARNRKLDERAIHHLWRQIKQAEKSTAPTPSFGDDASDLPAIYRAERLQQQAAEVGFDWPDIAAVVDKLTEELGELREAVESNNSNRIEGELGDLLFACVNIARHREINAEMALRRTNRKFIRRFEYVTAQMQRIERPMNPQQLEQMETFWQASKAIVG